jgi:AraC-like DNA-binding protein
MALELTRSETPTGERELIRRPALPRLRLYLGDYTGWTERARGRVLRVEMPFGGLPLIVTLGPEHRVSGPGGQGGGRFGSFVAGLHDTWVTTEFDRESAGVQVNLKPLGAFLLLGRPMHELVNRTLGLDELLGAEGRVLGERLAGVASWEKRFELLDGFVLARFARAPLPSPGVVRAWQRLEASHGCVAIGALAAEIDCSPRHLIELFRAQIGLPPKTLARVLRFERAQRLLLSGARATDVALACGYYDQAHLNRECRALAGTTPGSLVAGT